MVEADHGFLRALYRIVFMAYGIVRSAEVFFRVAHDYVMVL